MTITRTAELVGAITNIGSRGGIVKSVEISLHARSHTRVVESLQGGRLVLSSGYFICNERLLCRRGLFVLRSPRRNGYGVVTRVGLIPASDNVLEYFLIPN